MPIYFESELFCIIVDGEEIQCDHHFQCSECGEINEDVTVSLERGRLHRQCDYCYHQYPVAEFTEE